MSNPCPMNVWNHTHGCDCAKNMTSGSVTTAVFPGTPDPATPTGSLSPRQMCALPDVGTWPQEVDRQGFEAALPVGEEYTLKQNGVDVGPVTIGAHRSAYVHVKFPGSNSDSTGPVISATDRFVVDEKGSVYVVGERGTADFEFHPRRSRAAVRTPWGATDLSRLPHVGHNPRPLARERLSEALPPGVQFKQRNIINGVPDPSGTSHTVTIRGVRQSLVSVEYPGGGSGGPMLGSDDSFATDDSGRVYLMDERGEPYLMYEPY